jgi:hypothetical protein
MIRFTKALALAATLLAVPSMASALGIELAGTNGSGGSATLAPGGTITFDLRMTFDGTEPTIYGLSADVTGMDLADATGVRDFGLGLESGTSVDEALGSDPAPGIVGPQGALQNNNGTTPVERYSINHLSPQAYTVNLFDGISATGAGGDGSTDYGIGETYVTSGDIHFQVTLENVGGSTGASTVANLQFSLLALDFQGNTIASTGDTFTLTVVPEPGTALLMGLGLAGLATIRRS